MVKKVLSVLFLLINISTYSFSQCLADSLDINDNLKEMYIIGDTIDFCYTNNSSKGLFVEVSLERSDIHGNWQSYMDDVFNDYKFDSFDNIIWIMQTSEWAVSENKMNPIRKFRKDRWAIKPNCLYGKETIALYRFRYTIGQIPHGFVKKDTGESPVEKILFSKPFYIKKKKSTKKSEITKYNYEIHYMKP